MVSSDRNVASHRRAYSAAAQGEDCVQDVVGDEGRRCAGLPGLLELLATVHQHHHPEVARRHQTDFAREPGDPAILADNRRNTVVGRRDVPRQSGLVDAVVGVLARMRLDGDRQFTPEPELVEEVAIVAERRRPGLSALSTAEHLHGDDAVGVARPRSRDPDSYHLTIGDERLSLGWCRGGPPREDHVSARRVVLTPGID